MNEAEKNSVPDALLLIASGCPHCPTVLQGLSELVKAGVIGRLEVVNIGAHPEIAQGHGVRGVPWLRLGPFELEGLRAPAELRRWAERAGSNAGMADYVAELLKTGFQCKFQPLRHGRALLQSQKEVRVSMASQVRN